ncbi:MAG: succinate--CoA ligase subunit beta, partial [Bacteroidetes bacterium]
MNIHEYQAKGILEKYGVTIQKGIVADTPEEATEAAKKLNAETGTEWYVLKAQIHAGGRGKGKVKETDSNGVVLAKSLEDVAPKSKAILGGTLVTHQTGEEGKVVNKLLVAQDVYYPGEHEPKEYYVGILLDRAKGCNVIMASTEGGVDIEDVAENTPDKIIKEWIDPRVGLQGFQARKVAFKLGLEGDAFKNMVKFIHSLYNAYDATDSSMFEINPVLKTSDNKILAVDAKVNLDDSALYRHKDLAEMRDKSEEDPAEVEAAESGLNYVEDFKVGYSPERINPGDKV